MKYELAYTAKLFLRHRNEVFRCIAKRHTSTGVNLFERREPTVATHKQIEEYWKDKVNPHKYDETDSTKEPFYVLSMFPYPSGALHMGHVRVYTISDAVARFYRMTGKNVLHPMGWDAFGLPAENAAMEKNVDPGEWTNENITIMRKQLEMLNCSFDWDREFATCDSSYYKWTQELFLKLYEKGLVYQKEAFVNWDPVDKTVLAEEQVDSNNRSWRSGALVEKKLLNQWFIRTTVFAKSLYEGLFDPSLKEWKDVKKMQKNWIGKCDGMSFDFKLISDIPEYPKTINLWTDKPEFIEFAKFVAIPSTSILNRRDYSNDINEKIKILNAKVLNPFSGKELPIYVTDDVAFPHRRDNYLGIPSASMEDMEFSEKVGIQFDRHSIRSYEEQQEKISEISRKAREWKIGGYPVNARLQDWLISRQRYWGTPIPIIHCQTCGAQPVPREQLPVELPKIPSSAKKSLTLSDAEEWLKTSCPKCGGQATREADTMDTFVDSCWYFLRFIDPHNTKEMFSVDKAKKLFPVDLYIGGKEHAVLHMYYARFISHFLHSEGLLPTSEPFKQLLVQGMIMGKTYRLQTTGQYLKEYEVHKKGNVFKDKRTGQSVLMSWEKMSKSKYNGVDPLSLLEAHGIDITRLLVLADVAPTSNRHWSDETIPGVVNWLKRMWMTVRQFKISRDSMTTEDLRREPIDPKFNEDDAYMFDSRNYFLKAVTFNMTESQQLSVAISRMQGLTNSLRKVSKECILKSREFERALAVQIIMLSPLAPHFAAELWAGFCSARHHLIDPNEVDLEKDVFHQEWPKIDMNYKMTLTVFINSRQLLKLKVPLQVLESLTAETALELVMLEPQYQRQSENFKITDLKLLSKKGYDASLIITTTKVSQESVM